MMWPMGVGRIRLSLDSSEKNHVCWTTIVDQSFCSPAVTLNPGKRFVPTPPLTGFHLPAVQDRDDAHSVHPPIFAV